MACPFVIPPHPVCGRGTKPRGRLRVGLSPIPDAEPLTFCCERRRGIAVGLCSSGNYIAGALWPPVVQHFISGDGWRATHIGIGIVCIVTLLPLSFFLRRRHVFGPAAVPEHDKPQPDQADAVRLVQLGHALRGPWPWPGAPRGIGVNDVHDSEMPPNA